MSVTETTLMRDGQCQCKPLDHSPMLSTRMVYSLRYTTCATINNMWTEIKWNCNNILHVHGSKSQPTSCSGRIVWIVLGILEISKHTVTVSSVQVSCIHCYFFNFSCSFLLMISLQGAMSKNPPELKFKVYITSAV